MSTGSRDAGERTAVLGIETSCDETAAAVVSTGGGSGGGEEAARTVLSNVIASQHDLHAEYKGVVPEIASRAHAERLVLIVRAALEQAGVKAGGLAGVAVSNRPGLIGSLLVGVAGAKAMAWSLTSALGRDVPVIGVDHVQAHLAAGLIGPPGQEPGAPAWPALGLVVSGGHTSLYLCDSLLSVRRIGATIDDAIGEAYDKVATILGLPFPGGPNLDRIASECAGPIIDPPFPIARIAPGSLDFSFSGLKTAALYAFKGVPETARARARREARHEPPAPTYDLPTIAKTFQHAAVGAVLLKLERALERHPVKTLLVGGGVSANSLLRTRLLELARGRGLDVRLPRMEYCLDNAAMIAALGHAMLAERAWVGDDLTMTATPTTSM